MRWDTEGVVSDPTQLTLPDFSHDVTVDKVTMTTSSNYLYPFIDYTVM